MPRIYYNQEDYDLHLFLFVAHAITYTVGIIFIWLQTTPYVDSITILWTMLLAFHSYWRTRLDDGLQVRTYTRLRNRFGQDWDLAASPEEFEIERKKATLESKLRYVFRDSLRALPAYVASLITLTIFMEMPPVSIAVLMLVAYLISTLSLQIVLRWQLRRAIILDKAYKKKKSLSYPRLQDTDSSLNLEDYSSDIQKMKGTQSQDGG